MNEMNELDELNDTNEMNGMNEMTETNDANKNNAVVVLHTFALLRCACSGCSDKLNHSGQQGFVCK